MNVQETEADGLKRAYKATAPASEIAARIDQKLDAIRPTAQLRGFRKGKAPREVLKRMFGKSVLGEVVQELLDETVRSHLETSGHRPARQPDLKIVGEESFAAGQDLSVEFSYEMLPEIPDVALGEIALERLVVAVDQESVDKALASIADNAKSFEIKEGAAEDGDQAVIDFVGRIGDEPFEGGAAEDFPLVLGSKQFVPGFEEQLLGASAGDAREVAVQFPAEYGASHLAGQEAVFAVTVKEIKAPKPAAIDDDLAKRYGAADLAALTDQVRDRLAAEYRGGARAHLKRKLLDHLAGAVTFPLPQSLVDNEAREIAHQLWHEANPDVHGHDHEEVAIADEHRALAERRVRLGLLLAEIGRRNSVEVSESELANAVMAQARRYPGQEKAFFEFVQQNPQMRQQIAAPVFEDKVVDFIFEMAKVTDRTVDVETLKAELEKLEDAPEAA